MHCSKYPELADKSSPMYIRCGDGVQRFRRETLTAHSKSRRHVVCHTRSLNDQKREDRPLKKVCRIFWASSFVVRTSKIHIALVRMDKRIEKKVSCPAIRIFYVVHTMRIQTRNFHLSLFLLDPSCQVSLD